MTDILSDEKLAEIRAGLEGCKDPAKWQFAYYADVLLSLLARLDKAEEDREAWKEEVKREGNRARAERDDHEAEIAKLLDGWQDISTAPKDRAIFLWGCLECSARSRPHVGSEDRYEAIWHAEYEAWQAVDYGGWVVSPELWHATPAPPVGSGSQLADATPNPNLKVLPHEP